MQAEFRARHPVTLSAVRHAVHRTRSRPFSRSRKRAVMTTSFLKAAIDGVVSEVRRTGDWSIVPTSLAMFGKEVASLLTLIPVGIATSSLFRRIESLDGYLQRLRRDGVDAHAPTYDVLVHRNQKYGPSKRNTLDVYVPARVAQHLVDYTGRESPAPPAPVVFFTHGGVWASGETWHYVAMATRLAQAGVVVVMHTYTLYPDALVPQMIDEVNAALTWTLDNIHCFGGDSTQVTATGHSAGAHLVALALLQRTVLPPMPVAAVPVRTVSGQWAAPDPLPMVAPVKDSRMPTCCACLAGVFDIAKHEEHERMRGVHILSMMTRAMGGYEHFHRLSPSAILRRLAHDIAVQSSQHDSNRRPPPQPWFSHGQGPTQYYSSFGLLGEAIPQRLSDLLGANTGWHDADRESTPTTYLPAPPPPYDSKDEADGCGQGNGRGEHTQGQQQEQEGSVAVTVGSVGAGQYESQVEEDLHLTPQAVLRLPPFYVLAGCADHVVPWHEGAEMATALSRCGVPARFLLYQHADHAAFILSWTPLRHAPAMELAHPGRRMAHDDALLEGLTAWNKDYVRIVLGTAETKVPRTTHMHQSSGGAPVQPPRVLTASKL